MKKTIQNKRILIVGLGIAGMATAARLKKHGFEPIIIERAHQRRTGGYFIGIFPEGIKVAKELGVLNDIKFLTPNEIYGIEVDNNGNKKRGVGYLEQPGLPQATLRGNVEEGLWKNIKDNIEVRFGTSPEAIVDKENEVVVLLKNSLTNETYEESFDVVVGADGVRSKVRELVFGEHKKFLRPLNAMIVAFQMKHQVPGLKNEESITLAEPKRALWVFGLQDHAPTALFTFKEKNGEILRKQNPETIIRQRFEGLSGAGITEHVLEEYRHAPDALFDTVNIVKMPKWNKGRVVMVGDAAWCLTLFSGMGTTTAMLGAKNVADQIAANPNDLDKAFRKYHQSLRWFIEKHRLYTLYKTQFVIPSNAFVNTFRKMVVRWGASKLVKKELKEGKIIAPQYAC